MKFDAPQKIKPTQNSNQGSNYIKKFAKSHPSKSVGTNVQPSQISTERAAEKDVAIDKVSFTTRDEENNNPNEWPMIGDNTCNLGAHLKGGFKASASQMSSRA